MNIIRLFPILPALALASCSEDFFSQTVNVDPPAYEKQLVVHEFVADTDGGLRVELSRNFGILEDVPLEDYNVSGATVSWYDNGQLAATLTPLPDSGWVYTGEPGVLQAGRSYELRAEHPDFPMIRAVQTMPAAPEVDSVAYRSNGGINGNGDEVSAFDVYLRDPGGSKQYYEIRVRLWQYLFEYERDAFGNLVFDSLGNPIVIDTVGVANSYVEPDDPEDPNAEFGTGQGLFIGDATFDGQRYKFTFRVGKVEGSLEGLPKEVVVRSVTEEYYQYALSRYRKDEAGDNPLSEPVTVFSNVQNGLGMFGLVAQRVFVVE